ncbi:MAG: 1-deoxy-D-xylulose-5-phosphate reductoisomerase [Propionibacteriaceae bacterium]
MRRVALLGSTGSIGTQTCDVVRSRPAEFEIVALAAGGTQSQALAKQVAEFQPAMVAIADEKYADQVRSAITALTDYRPQFSVGDEAILACAQVSCDVVMNAITGAAGLHATLATLAAGTTLALANKESLVIGGKLVTQAAAPGQIVAVDSEHSAFAQALRSGRSDEVERLILTASGGPFRGKTRQELSQVTPAQAMAHPTWDMGRVITINSATLVNKGLELIEAALLYDVSYDQIQVVVHPQSIVHSAVEFIDGSTIAQVSPPDMRLPIALGIDWPRRIRGAAPTMNWANSHTWTFEPLDDETFPAVELARRVGKKGGTAPAVYNAANEACVDAFCVGQLSFLGITDTISSVVAEHEQQGWVDAADISLDIVMAADAWARQRVTTMLASH